MLGYHQSDESGPGDDGTYDAPVTVVSLGMLLPLMIVGFAAYVAWDGGITLRGKGGPSMRYSGFHAVASVVSTCLGFAMVLVAK